jgi:hypothetical protein
MEKSKGARGIGPIAVEQYDRNTQTLADLGITKDQSSAWQKLARIPEPDFDALALEGVLWAN